MFVFLQTPEPWFKVALEFWPVFVTIAGIVFACIAFIFGARWVEKAGIDKANEKAVNALKELVAARDAEIDDRDAEIEKLKSDCNEGRLEFVELESEYKALAGIALAELMTWAARYDEHRADLARKESEIRILKLQIDRMEQRDADLHTSKP